jgi:hypothetical protein
MGDRRMFGPGCMPVERYEDRSRTTNQIIARASEMELAELAAAARVQRRPVREFDLYAGPVLVAVIVDRPGFILGARSDGNIVGATKHPFVDLRQRDLSSEQRVLAALGASESFDHFVRRLLASGYDVAAHSRLGRTTPAGRCWTVAYAGERIGALFDYPGQFSGLEWQPLPTEPKHSEITMTVYVKDSDPHYLQCWKFFAAAKGIGDMRLYLESNGYVLEPGLFNPF